MKILISVLSGLVMALAAAGGLLLALWMDKHPHQVARVLPESPMIYWLAATIFVVSAFNVILDLLRAGLSERGTVSRSHKALAIALSVLAAVMVAAVASVYVSTGGVKYVEAQIDPATQVRKYISLIHEPPPSALLVNDRRVGRAIGDLYDLRISYPRAMHMNQDGKVEIYQVIFSSGLLDLLYSSDPEPESLELLRQIGPPPDELDVHVALTSNSFEIDPGDSHQVPLLSKGIRHRFLITPKETGRRGLQLRSQLSVETAEYLGIRSSVDRSSAAIEIEVLPEPVCMGFSMQEVKAFSLLASGIGLPSAAVMIVGMLLAFVKGSWEKRQESRASKTRRRRRKRR